MKSKEELIKEQTGKLHPIGTRVFITRVRDLDFYKQGVIISHLHNCGSFVWDYLIKLDDGRTIYKDDVFVDVVS